MQRFRFSLNTVLDYKQQIEDALQGEYSMLLAKVRTQEALLAERWAQYRSYGAEYREQCEKGLPISDVLVYQSGLRALEREIEEAAGLLRKLEEQAEKKREEVVEARKETASIEKLKERKLEEYNKLAAKSEEAAVEEFVSAVRVRQAAVR